jgi:hypothetical protein
MQNLAIKNENRGQYPTAHKATDRHIAESPDYPKKSSI